MLCPIYETCALIDEYLANPKVGISQLLVGHMCIIASDPKLRLSAMECLTKDNNCHFSAYAIHGYTRELRDLFKALKL
jgi:hypothetical protein